MLQALPPLYKGESGHWHTKCNPSYIGLAWSFSRLMSAHLATAASMATVPIGLSPLSKKTFHADADSTDLGAEHGVLLMMHMLSDLTC